MFSQRGWTICAAVFLGLALCATSEEDGVTTLYVATDGNDAWSGRLPEPNADGTDGPLASLAGARSAIRALKASGAVQGAVQVLVRGGTYSQPAPLVLTPEDSGAPDAPVTVAAYPDETPLISGGRRIRGWRQEGDLWVAEIPEVKAGTWDFSALWVNGERCEPARMPNEGYFYTQGKAPALKDPATGKETQRGNTAFEYAPGDIQPWDNLEDAVVVVFHSWATSLMRIASIDEDNHIVNFTGPARWDYMRWRPKQRYYVSHIFEALDAPGEWCLNRKTGRLYYHPLEGQDMTQAEVIAPLARQFVVFEGVPTEGKFVEHVHFRGLTFQYSEFTVAAGGHSDAQAAFSVPAAIQATGARRCSIEGCTIAHVGTYAIWLRAGCKGNRVARNHCHDLGAGGVRIGEGGSPASEDEAAEHNLVDNNWIHDGGRIFRSAVGVWIGRSSHNTASHNEISDLFYTGVSVGWSWGYAPSSAHHNIIEYNHIHHLGFEVLSDMGGIYTLGIAPGTVLRYNLIHDVRSFLYGGWGIYPDEGSSDLLIENNVVYNTKTGGFHQHYGRENLVRNNIFAFSWEGQIIRSREEDHISFLLERNIVYFNNGRLLGSNWKNGNYKLDYNCYWDTSGAEINFASHSLEEWQAKGYDVLSIIADPLFEDAEHLDFRLKPESPAIALGFEPIDISTAGLYGGVAWVNGPKQIPREPSPLPKPPKP